MATVQKDMTVGNPYKIILAFSLPLLLGNFFHTFYNMADTIIVGQFIGTSALAAVGSTGTIMFLIHSVTFGMANGFTIVTAQRFGAGDYVGMRKSVVSAMFLSITISVILTVVALGGAHWLLSFMKTPADIFDDAYTYMMIICAGIIAQTLYNLLSSLLRALGNSRIPLYFVIISAALNIVLDILLIIVFDMDVAGTALATIISQAVSGILCLIYILMKVPILHPKKEELVLDKALIRQQLGIGVPMSLQSSITSIGSMMVQTSLNMLGSTYVAAFTAGSKVEQLLTQYLMALSSTMASYSAQNTGARDVGRIRQGFKAAAIIGSIYSLICAAIAIPFGKYMTYLFISDGVEEIIELVGVFVRCSVSFFIALNIVNTFRTSIQGIGYGLMPMTAGIAELIGRGIVSVIAARYQSFLGICMAGPTAWVLAGTLLICMYFYIRKHDFPKMEQEKLAAENTIRE